MKNMKLSNLLNLFEVDNNLINKTMSIALEKGGDYCDLYFQNRTANYISLEDKSVNRAHTNIDFGVGIRVIKGIQTGYSFTEEISPKSMKLAATTATNIANKTKKISPYELKIHKIPDLYPIKTQWEHVNIEQKIPILKTINEKVFSLDKRVIKSNIMFMDESNYILIASSDGRISFDFQPMTTIAVSCTAEQKGKKEQNSFSISGREDINFFTPSILEHLAKETVSRTVKLFDAIKPKPGEMEIVMASGSSGILLHEAIGHGMEADFNRKKTSIFSDKNIKQIINN